MMPGWNCDPPTRCSLPGNAGTDRIATHVGWSNLLGFPATTAEEDDAGGGDGSFCDHD